MYFVFSSKNGKTELKTEGGREEEEKKRGKRKKKIRELDHQQSERFFRFVHLA